MYIRLCRCVPAPPLAKRTRAPHLKNFSHVIKVIGWSSPNQNAQSTKGSNQYRRGKYVRSKVSHWVDLSSNRRQKIARIRTFSQNHCINSKDLPLGYCIATHTLISLPTMSHSSDTRSYQRPMRNQRSVEPRRLSPVNAK